MRREYDKNEYLALMKYFELSTATGLPELPEYSPVPLTTGFKSAWRNRRMMTGRRGSRK